MLPGLLAWQLTSVFPNHGMKVFEVLPTAAMSADFAAERGAILLLTSREGVIEDSGGGQFLEQ